MGAVGRPVGTVVVTRCDRSRMVDWWGQMPSWVADSLATLEEKLWRAVLSSWFSFWISESWRVTVSSGMVIATMPENVVHRIERMEPLPALMVWKAWGEKYWTRSE